MVCCIRMNGQVKKKKKKNPAHSAMEFDVSSIQQELGKPIWVNGDKMKKSWTITIVRILYCAVLMAFSEGSEAR